MLDGSRSFFNTAESCKAALADRVAQCDIHPSAPWWGRGRTAATDICGELESTVLDDFQDLCAGLEKAGLAQERRAIRALAPGLVHEWVDEKTLRLRFLLSPGVFATTMLNELCLCFEPERG